MTIVKIKLLRKTSKLPSYATAGSAGMDLYADLEYATELEPGEHALIPTGVAIQLPWGYEGQVRSRSGLALQCGVSVMNSPGTIDEDYTGEIGVILLNHGPAPYYVCHGDRIAQLVIAPVTAVSWLEVDNLNPTDRGEQGFGSTGTN